MGIEDQAGTCAQLFYVKERSYGFEQELDVAIKVVMVMKDMVCKGWILSPLYDVNPVPYGDELSLNVDEEDNRIWQCRPL